MDFVFTEDIARANLLAAASDATDEVFNIGSSAEVSLLQLAELLQRVDGIGTTAGIRPGAGRQWGDPQAGRYHPAREKCWAGSRR